MKNPKYIKVGNTEWIRENSDTNYYNVNGRMFFERLHISVFPKSAILDAVIKERNKKTAYEVIILIETNY